MARAWGTGIVMLSQQRHPTYSGNHPADAPAILSALANSSLGPSDHTHRLRLAMAAPARIKGTCLSGRRRRRATLAAAPALAAVLLAAPCVGLVQNHALAASRPARARPTRPCVKATATRLPSLASNVLKLKEEVLNPKPDANGWCLGRESVEKALEEMRNGRPVVVTDDGDRENEGDLIFAAETVSQQTMAFVVRHTSGVICTAMYGEDLDRLKLGPMVRHTVSVDLLARRVDGLWGRAGRFGPPVAAMASYAIGPRRCRRTKIRRARPLRSRSI